MALTLFARIKYTFSGISHNNQPIERKKYERAAPFLYAAARMNSTVAINLLTLLRHAFSFLFVCLVLFYFFFSLWRL